MHTRDPAPAAALPSRSLAFRPSLAVEALEPRQLLAGDAAVTISTTRQQTMEGFGTSLGGVTSVSLIKTPAFQKAYYQDLGASVFRVALNPWPLKGTTAKGGSSIGSAVYMGPKLAANIAQFDFNDYNTLKYGRFARAAVKYGSDVRIIGSVWSPPYWMKGVEVNPSTGKPTGVQPTFDDKSGNTSGGSLIDTDETLTQFGRYVAAYVRGFEQAYGVTMYGISIQNELAFHEPYSSAVYSPDLYVKAVKAVSRWFTKYSITTRIMGPEDVGVGKTGSPGILSRQMAYIKAVRKDPEALAAIDDYSIHGYADSAELPTRSPDMWRAYYNGNAGKNAYDTWTGIKADHKPSWMTETSSYSDDWNGAMRMAGAMQDAIIQANTSAYVYWGISNSYANSEALTVDDDYQAGKYEAFKHFSKFVRPGAVRLTTTGIDPAGVYVSAYAEDAAKTLTTVMTNQSEQAKTVTLDLPGIALSAFTTAYESTAEFVWRQLKPMRVEHGRVTIVMPPLSIFTLQGTLGTADATPPAVVSKLGAIRGVYFLDTNKNASHDKGERGLAGDKVFIDLNDNGRRDAREPFGVTAADGSFEISGLRAGTYRVRRELPPGYTLVSRAANVAVAAGRTTGRVLIGVAAPAVPTVPPVARPTLGSVAGHAFNDTDGDGRQDAGESDAVGKTVFLDTDNDGRADSGERTATTNGHGDFGFTGLAAGTYRVRRVVPQGFRTSTASITVTLTPGQKRTGLVIGTTAA